MTVALSIEQYDYIRSILILEQLALKEFINKRFGKSDVPDSIYDEKEMVDCLLSTAFKLRNDKSRV